MLTITTYDWVPDFARGYVRDLRACWACEEAGLLYRVDTVPLRGKSDAHRSRQPFAQVPMLRDGDIDLFESGAIVLHLADTSDALMPIDPKGRAEVTSWIFAALNSIEPFSQRWLLAKVFDKDTEAAQNAAPLMNDKLAGVEAVLATRPHVAAGRFTAADILLADVLRSLRDEGALGDYPAAADYVGRMTDRPAFRKAHADQIARFTAADAAAPVA